VGERLLLALSYGGVTQVCFIGPGTQPACDRADLAIVGLDSLKSDEDYLVLTSDTVFDKGLLSTGTLPEDIALRHMNGASIKTQSNDLDALVTGLGTGSAQEGRNFAIRILTQSAASQAQRALLLSLRKPIDGFVSTHLNRYVSLFCTRFLVKMGLPPNFFTVIFLAIGLTGAFMATQAEYWWAILLAGVLFQTQSILDGCDGEMARLTYQFSRRGQWLDSIGDDITNYSVCLGLAIGQARVLDAPYLYWLGGGVLLVHMITSFVLYRRMVIMGTGDLLAIPDLVRTKTPTGLTGAVSEIVKQLVKRDSFIFILSVIIATQHPLVAFVLYGLGTLPMAYGVLLNDFRIARNPDASKQRVNA